MPTVNKTKVPPLKISNLTKSMLPLNLPKSSTKTTRRKPPKLSSLNPLKMTTRKKLKVPILDFTKIRLNKNDPFIDNIILLNNINYSQIKDFPIWWSGFFISDNERDKYDGVYDSRGEMLAELMIKASRIVKGFTTMDVKIKDGKFTDFDDDQHYEDEDEIEDEDQGHEPIADNTVVVTNHTDSGIVTNHTDSGIVTNHTDSGIVTNHTDSGIIYTESPKSTQRTSTPSVTLVSTARSTQRASTQRSTQRASTQRSTQRSRRQFASPIRATPRNPFKELMHKNLSASELVKARKEIILKRERNYSKKFTLLALQSDPKDIGLFVNCSPDEFVNKLFYNLEFGVILNYYKIRKMPFTLHIFNIKNDNCLNLQKKIMLTYNKLIKERLNQTQIVSELTESIKNINCYDLLELVQIAKKRMKGAINYNDPNELILNKIYSIKDVTERNKEYKKFISEIINPITEKLKDKTCHIKSNKKFMKLKNKIYTLLGKNYPETEVDSVQSVWDLSKKNDDIFRVFIMLHNFIYNYFFETDYTCFTVYNNIKELISDITNQPDIKMTIIQSRIKEIYNTLQQENNKDCLGIKQKLLKKIETDKLGKSLITFNCLTCANLIDCAKIIRNRIVNPKVIISKQIKQVD